MKQLLQKLIGCVVVLSMILVGIILLGHVVRPLDTDGAHAQVEAFHSLPENALEVIMYGSSHTYTGIDPIEMYESYGIGAYNYGWNWQKINTTTLFLKDSLLSQKPKVVLVDTYTCNQVLQDVDISPEIYYSRYIHDKTAKKEYLEQCFGRNFGRYVSYYFPLIPFHDNWNSISYSSFLPVRGCTFDPSTMGFLPVDIIQTHTIPDPAGFTQKELSETALAELEEIVSVCKENNIELIFITIPHAHEFNYGEAMEKFSQANGCKYLNLFNHLDEIGIDGTTDFFDYSHLNISGAAKVANFLGEYLVNNYDLTDMRTIDGNIWQPASLSE